MKDKFASFSIPAKQRGVAILVVTVILLLVATIGTLAIGRVGLEEQRIVGTDVRGKELYSAATGGLEYAVKWFEWEEYDGVDASGNPIYTPNYLLLTFNQPCRLPDTESNCAYRDVPNGKKGPAPAGIAGGSANNYAQDVRYKLLSEDPLTVRAYTLAIADGDSHIQKTVSVDLFVGEKGGGGPFVGGSSTFDGPPIVVENCMSGVTGTPDIVVMDDLDATTPTPAGIVTITGDLDGSCIQTGHGNQYECPGPSFSDCPTIGGGRVRTNGGGAAPQVTTVIGEADPQPPSLFESIFDYDPNDATDAFNSERDFIEYLAQLDPERIGVFDTTGELMSWISTNYGGVGNIGSQSEPVIMYLGSNFCPKLNGGYRVYGLVYFANLTCDQNGWGNSQIFGTMAKAGDITKLTANTQFINEGALNFDFGAKIDDDQKISKGLSELVVSVIPGTWRDF